MPMPSTPGPGPVTAWQILTQQYCSAVPLYMLVWEGTAVRVLSTFVRCP
jgi:hypothetical protein